MRGAKSGRITAGLGASLGDVAWGVWRIWTNRVVGSHVLPGPWRGPMLRAAGLRCYSDNISGGVTFTRPRVTIGARSRINEGVFLEAAAPITIGDNCVLGAQVTIITSTYGLSATANGRREPFVSPVHLGDDCWLATRVTVLPGVRIRSGIIVTAGALVVRDLEIRGVYSGVPARLRVR